jgi:hypothetical protein
VRAATRCGSFTTTGRTLKGFVTTRVRAPQDEKAQFGRA